MKYYSWIHRIFLLSIEQVNSLFLIISCFFEGVVDEGHSLFHFTRLIDFYSYLNYLWVISILLLRLLIGCHCCWDWNWDRISGRMLVNIKWIFLRFNSVFTNNWTSTFQIISNIKYIIIFLSFWWHCLFLTQKISSHVKTLSLLGLLRFFAEVVMYVEWFILRRFYINFLWFFKPLQVFSWILLDLGKSISSIVWLLVKSIGRLISILCVTSIHWDQFFIIITLLSKLQKTMLMLIISFTCLAKVEVFTLCAFISYPNNWRLITTIASDIFVIWVISLRQFTIIHRKLKSSLLFLFLENFIIFFGFNFCINQFFNVFFWNSAEFHESFVV